VQLDRQVRKPLRRNVSAMAARSQKKIAEA